MVEIQAIFYAHLRQKQSAMFTKTFGVTKAHIKTGDGFSTEKLSNPDVHMLEINAKPELEVRGIWECTFVIESLYFYLQFQNSQNTFHKVENTVPVPTVSEKTIKNMVVLGKQPTIAKSLKTINSFAGKQIYYSI